MTDRDWLKSLGVAADEDAADAASEIAMLESLNDRQAGQITELLNDLYTARANEERHRKDAAQWRRITLCGLFFGALLVGRAMAPFVWGMEP